MNIKHEQQHFKSSKNNKDSRLRMPPSWIREQYSFSFNIWPCITEFGVVVANRYKTQLSSQIKYFQKSIMAFAGISNSESPLQYLYWMTYLTIFAGMLQVRHKTLILFQLWTFPRIKDGVCRHVKFQKAVVIPPLFGHSSLNSIAELWTWYIAQLLCQKQTFTKIEDDGWHHLYFKSTFAIVIPLELDV